MGQLRRNQGEKRSVFGQLKTCQKMTMMSQRGLAACESEWLFA
jgi:hypothetical protein